MTTQNPIVRNNSKPLSQDYEQLRALGLQYIEQFSKDLWTDYNVHDPGITTMEIVNYAITDLAMRTSLPMEDMLARDTGDTTKDFFSAREILPCNPVTFDDLRKKIIDVKGVENAWVTAYDDEPCANPITNPAYFISCNIPSGTIDLNAEFKAGYEPRNLYGLYKFNLLLEEDETLGDLNIVSVDWEMRNPITGARKALVRFFFPLLPEKTYPGKSNVDTDIEKIASGSITSYAVSNLNTAINTFDLTLNPGPQQIVISQVAFHIQIVHTTDQLATLKQDMWSYLSSAIPATQAEVLARIMSILQAKTAKISSIIDEVYCMYHHIRNLCEDVIKIGVVPTQEIAVCADIETDPAVDLEDILGRIYFAIDTFFSPPLHFYLLSELIAKGYPTDIIFEGPLLKHGFLLDQELRKKSLFNEIHVSDLYNLIMSIEGVNTVKYLQITNYLNGIAQTDGEFWKIILNGNFHLNLDRLRSKITFYKGDLPIHADKQVAERIYADFKATLSKPRLDPALKIPNDLLPPAGNVYKLDEYYSIQNDFPGVYGVNADGIPSESDIQRKTRIKQLKGYLLFFDQLLANYLAQLTQLKNLYAIGSSGTWTYFTQPVYDIPIADSTEDAFVYSNNPAPFPDMPDPETLNFYDSGPLLKDFVDFATPAFLNSIDIDDRSAYETEWKDFANHKLNGYRAKLMDITEPEDESLDRRNRFLDHLLSRFAENFADYAAMMYKFTGNTFESSSKKTAVEIVEDKFRFLQQYHIQSYNRSRGLYYKCCPTGNCNIPPVQPAELTTDEILEYDTFHIPDPANATGLHLRATALLGMNIQDNRLLVKNKFTVQPSGPAFIFIIQYDPTHDFESTITYATEEEAYAAMEDIVELILDQDDEDNDNVYLEVKPFGFGFRIEIKQTPVALTPFAVSTPLYATEELALEGLAILRQAFFDEGMHVIDHLLLRPLPVDQHITAPDLVNGFFPLCADLNTECDCPITDYYSFRISVILPYWTARFRNMDFRAFAEDAIHRETPAHILPKFCWVSMFDMQRLENDYESWFAENKKYKPNMNTLKDKLKQLIKTLNTMTNVYPEGHLHDCENPSTDNPVILNQTILGTF